ncbi:MAG: hypothetical protein NC340_03885 [Ruminococcus flavefaciens]|nr:hypothetical protein [Ruminococcus flavefaciens]MCM1229191.1 hypothetical protein [Ruminococcus flavefaciens]
MEFIISLIVIIVLCKVIGISNATLIAGGLCLIELAIIAMLLLFIYFCLHLFFAGRKKAVFVRTDKPEGSKFQVAYYLIDGEEYPCVFPRESGLAYKTDRTCTVWYSKRLKKVYDIWATLTCIIGLAFSIMAVYLSLQILSFAAVY